MSKQLNNNQINHIQNLKDAGDYDLAYRYIAEQIETNVQDGTVTRETQKWFEWAEQINGNQGTVVDKYARTFAQIGASKNGITLTNQGFQDGSDVIARSVLQKIMGKQLMKERLVGRHIQKILIMRYGWGLVFRFCKG